MTLERRLQRVVAGLAPEAVQIRDAGVMRVGPQRLLHRPAESGIRQGDAELRLAREVAEQQVAVPADGVERNPVELVAVVAQVEGQIVPRAPM